MANLISFRSLAASGPASVRGAISRINAARGHIVKGAEVLAKDATGGVVGLGLGAIHAQYGLDVKKVPMDFAGSVVMSIAAVGLGSHEPVAAEAVSNAAAAAMTVFGFRKGYSLRSSSLKKAGKAAVGTFAGDFDAIRDGDMGADPLLEAVKALG